MNSSGFYRKKDNELYVQDICVSKLAKKYGTPLFIYDCSQIRQRYETYLNTISEVNGKIHYAVKANDSLSILKYFAKLGSGADIVSIGELKKCILAGIEPKKIIFSGVGKYEYEIEEALKQNILQFNIESKEELYDIHKICLKLKLNANICLRVNPNIAPSTHKKISTGDKGTKFGIDYENVKSIYKKLHNLDYINPVGLAVHIGSQIFDFNYFHEAYQSLKNLADDLIKIGYKVPSLDLGGGIGVSYKRDKKIDFLSYKKIISNLFKDTNYELSFEPGRSLIAEAGILVTKVIRNKKTKAKNFVIIDAAMNNLIRPTLYDAYHQVEPAIENDRSFVLADIVGPICETGDYLALNRKIKKVNKDELLIIRATGAYSSVMSSNYNSRPDAKEVIIYNNKDYLIKYSQTIEDLILKDKLINFD